MKLTKIAAAPKLVPVVIDAEDIVAEYGETLEFYTYDRQPLDMFMQLANANAGNISEVMSVVKKMILDEKGKEILTGEVTLPNRVLLEAVNKMVALLGK